jgi:hypothetical protein
MVRRRARPNPKAEWVVEGAPALRIVSDDLWSSVRSDRQRRGIAWPSSHYNDPLVYHCA